MINLKLPPSPQYTVSQLDKAIGIMERASKRTKGFNLCRYQTHPNIVSSTYASTEQEFYECGAVACFAGYVAISPEFHADGGQCGFYGQPVLGELGEEDAITEWLGISVTDACSLMFNNTRASRRRFDALHGRFALSDEESYYGKSDEEVTAQDVIIKLKKLRDKVRELNKIIELEVPK